MPSVVATELDVTWNKPSTTPCPVDSYIVEYELLIEDQCRTVDFPER